MRNTNPAIVVAAFTDSSSALKAVQALRDAKFERGEIGFVSRSGPAGPGADSTASASDIAAAGVLATGMAAGAVGASPVMPNAGAVLAGGALGAALIASGALSADIRAALSGAGMSDEESRYYETEYESDRSIVIVKTADRVEEAARILKQHGGVGRVR